MMLEQEGMRQSVLTAMSDEYMRKILAATMVRGKSAEEISYEKSIPLSTCYRRIRELLSMNLLRLEHTEITAPGKKFVTYRSVLGDVKVSLTPEELTIEVSVIPKVREDWAIGKILLTNGAIVAKDTQRIMI